MAPTSRTLDAVPPVLPITLGSDSDPIRHADAVLFQHSQLAMQLSPIFLLDRGDPHHAPYPRLSRMVPYQHRHEFPGI